MCLLDETKRLLNNRPQWLTLKVVAIETGISYSAVKLIAANPDPNPTIKTLQKLHDYLTDRVAG